MGNSEAIDRSQSTVRRTSDLLHDFAHSFTAQRVRLGDLDQALPDRAFGFLLLIFSLPNTIPLGVPGLSTLTAIPLGLIALQMMLGMEKPYLPRWLADRSLERRRVVLLIEKVTPTLRRLEKLVKPGWTTTLFTPAVERLLGGFCLLLAIVLAAPIPFSNVPLAIGIAFISLGITERNAVLMSVGVAVGAAAILIAGGVIWAMTQAVILFLGHRLAG